MELDRLINVNPMFDTIIGGMISEYDIKSAGATAIRELRGEETYDYLMSLPKLERNIKIGLMMRSQKGLSEQVNMLMLKWLNMFIKENKIKQTNFICTSRDSVTVYNKIPMKTKFGNVEFRNKDGMFSSMYRIKRLTLYFDSMRGHIIGKGVNDDVVEKSEFLQSFLKRYLYMFESCQKYGDESLFTNLTHMRSSYMKSDLGVFKDLFNENKLGVRFRDEMMYMDNDFESDDEEFVVAKDLNYINIVMPIMRSVMLNG